MTFRLYYPLCVSRRVDSWHIVYLSYKDPCPKISVHKSEIKLGLAELPCNWAGLNDGLFSETMDFRDFPSVLSAVRIAQS